MKEKSTRTTNGTGTANRVVDDEPPTGVVNYIVVASVLAIVSLAGVVMIKSKK